MHPRCPLSHLRSLLSISSLRSILQQPVLAAAQHILSVGDDTRLQLAQAERAQGRFVEPDHGFPPRIRAVDDGCQRHRFARADGGEESRDRGRRTEDEGRRIICRLSSLVSRLSSRLLHKHIHDPAAHAERLHRDVLGEIHAHRRRLAGLDHIQRGLDHIRLAAAAAHRAHVPAQRVDDHLRADLARDRAFHLDDRGDRHRFVRLDELAQPVVDALHQRYAPNSFAKSVMRRKSSRLTVEGTE